MDIKKRDPAGKGEIGSGTGKNIDLAGQAAVGIFRGKAHMDQRSGQDLVQGYGILSIADAGFIVDAEAHRNGVDHVAKHHFAMAEINVNDLPVGIGWKRDHANADIAGKNIVLVVVELGIHVNALAFFERKLRGFSAVMEDMRAFVKVYGPRVAAKDFDGKLIAHAVYARDGAAQQRGSRLGNRRRIENGIVAVCGQCSTGR